MREIRIPGKNGRMILDYNQACPFVAENGFEEALLFYLHKISNGAEDQLASIQGEIDNAVEARLIGLEETLSVKLDAVISELQQIKSKGGCSCHG